MRPAESEDEALLREMNRDGFAHVRFFRGTALALILSAPFGYLIWEFVPWHL